MRNIRKCLMVLLIVNILINAVYLFKYEVHADTISNIISGGTTFINKGSEAAEDSNVDITGITSSFKGIGQLLTLVGGGVLVAVVSYMGIKYLTSSPDKQAVLKQQLIGVVVSGIVIFGAYGIWKAIINVVSAF